MPGVTKSQSQAPGSKEQKTERKWQFLLVLDTLGTALQSRHARHATVNACKVPYQASTSPRVEGKVTGMRKPQGGLEA